MQPAVALQAVLVDPAALALPLWVALQVQQEHRLPVAQLDKAWLQERLQKVNRARPPEQVLQVDPVALVAAHNPARKQAPKAKRQLAASIHITLPVCRQTRLARY